MVEGTQALYYAGEVAAAIANGVGIVDNLKSSYELAEDYYELYKQQRDFYYTTFQLGVEAPLAAEVFADPVYVQNYGARLGTLHDTVTGPLGGMIGDTAGWIARHRAMYAFAPTARVDAELPLDKARIASDWANYLSRFEEHIYDVEGDLRWRRRMTLHNIGMRQGTGISGALDRALGGFQEQLNGLGDQLATYGNGIAKYAGYKRGLADTSDDFARRLPASNLPDNLVERGVRV